MLYQLSYIPVTGAADRCDQSTPANLVPLNGIGLVDSLPLVGTRRTATAHAGTHHDNKHGQDNGCRERL